METWTRSSGVEGHWSSPKVQFWYLLLEMCYDQKIEFVAIPILCKNLGAPFSVKRCMAWLQEHVDRFPVSDFMRMKGEVLGQFEKMPYHL